MSTSPPQSLYRRIHSTLSSPTGTLSVTIYTSADRVHFDAYPSSISGFSTISFATILHELRAYFAVHITGPHIQAAIDSAPWPVDEIDLRCGYGVRVVEDSNQLISTADGWQSAAFVHLKRADSSLVIWHDYEDKVLSNWSDISIGLQNRFGDALPNPSPIAGLPGDTYFDRYLHADALEGSLLQGDSLPLLNELEHLATVPGPATPPPTLPSQSYLHAHWPWVQSDSPSVGGLQLALQVLSTSSPSSDVPSSSFGGTPFTIELPTISPSLFNTLDLPEDDDGTSNISLDFTSDGVESPRSSDGSHNSYTRPHTTVVPSYRRHSFGETRSATARTGGKTKRGLSAEDSDDDYVSNVHVKDETVGGDTFPPVANAATRHRHVPSVHASKRRRSLTQATPTSAPALIPVPLPTVEHAGNNYDGGESTTVHPPTAPGSGSGSAPAPASTSTSSSQRRARRRTGTGAGRASRAKRTPCEHCGKTFSRVQDAQRHVQTSCAASPEKEGVVCPECNSVLSRLDAAQRHWRGHENPTSPPPVWMNRS
ncbi:hypothetical protein BJV78DRAFT_1155099 [Lactifluus subvellereus]|nr:hypothetical protein BJV78DRAFT_1155099 [Lactifluus subvellereus]